MNYLKNFAVMLVAVMLVTSCGNGYKKSETGLEYKFYVQNEGENPKVGDFITIDMYYGTDDTILFDSKNIPGGLTFPLDSPYFEGDLFDVDLFAVKLKPFFKKDKYRENTASQNDPHYRTTISHHLQKKHNLPQKFFFIFGI